MTNSKIYPFIMAAGESTRMSPLNMISEKSLLPDVDGHGRSSSRIIVERLLGDLSYQAATHPVITICILKKHLPAFQWEYRDIKDVKFHTAPNALGTASHLMDATSSLEDDANVLIHYADNITEVDYYNFVKKYQSMPQYKAAIVITKKARIPYSSVDMIWIGKDDIEVVSRFEEKPYVQKPTWTGIGIFNLGFLRHFIQDVRGKLDFGHDVLPELASATPIMTYEAGEWFDVGSVHHYLAVREHFAKKKT